MITSVPRRVAAVAAALALATMLGGCGKDTVRHSIAATLVNSAPGFAPDTITVNQEEHVILKVGNGTATTHGFSIEGYRVTRTVDPNQTIDVKFKANRQGTFRIYCQLHPAHQTATLIVQ